MRIRGVRYAGLALALVLLSGACGGGGSKTTKAARANRLVGGGDSGASASPVSPAAPDASTELPGQSTGSGGSSSSKTSSSKSSGSSSASTGSSGASTSGPAAAGIGVTLGTSDNSVLFGMHLPISGAVGALVGRSWHGADAYFKSVNAAGGVNGRQIKMVVSDDGYDATKAAGAIRELVDTKKVFAASCLAGSDQCVVGATYANAKGVPYFHTGMSEFSVANKPWAFPTGATYPFGARRLVDYLFQKRGFTPAKRFGALFVNTEQITRETVPALESQLAKYGAKLVARAPAEKDQVDFSTAITKMKQANVNAVWFLVDPTLIAKFTAQAGPLQFHPTYVFFSPAGGDLYATATGGGLDGAVGVTSIADANWSGAAKFRETFAKYYGDQPDEFNILAFSDAQVFVEGLKLTGRALGRDAFARAMASIALIDTGISSPISYKDRNRVTSANSKLAAEEVHGTSTNQISGFDF